MNTDERRRIGREREPTDAEDVMRYWLREEVDDAGDDLDPDALGTEPGLREELFERVPVAERAFAVDPAEWYRIELSEAELRDLRVVVGPHGEDWRAVADDDRIESIAERVYATDSGRLDEELPKDVAEVVAMADDIGSEGSDSRLVVLKEGDDPAYVIDGNHRAVAHVLHLLRGGEFAGQEAYLGVRE